MSKPSDLFIGVIDFFAVFLPGGILTYILYYFYGSSIFTNIQLNQSEINNIPYWIAYLFCSYLFGHIIFMFGSKLDFIYDIHRRKRNPYTDVLAFNRASLIMSKHLHKNDLDTMKTYEWCISVLTINHPEALIEIQRLIADSKFFRSLVIIIPIISLLFFINKSPLLGIIVISFILPCYARYYGRRLKSTSRCYQYIITLNGLDIMKSEK